MQQRQLGPFTVSAISLGCMNLSHAYGAPVSAEQAERVLLAALDAGVTMFDTAALYGFGANETLVGNVLSKHRRQFTLASKCGMQGVDVNGDGKLVRVIDGRPATIRATCEAALKRLRTDVIDLYYLHRWDKQVPIEDSVGALSDLVRAGKIQAIGLSEVSAATLRRAHAVHPITALQTEYSLWTRNPEIAVLDACRELGVAFVAFSPVARGFLCGEIDVACARRQGHPPHDAALRARKLCSQPEVAAGLAGHREGGGLHAGPARAGLAAAQGRGHHPDPRYDERGAPEGRPGRGEREARRREVMARLEALINQDTVAGNRYNPQANSEVDTEVFERA